MERNFKMTCNVNTEILNLTTTSAVLRNEKLCFFLANNTIINSNHLSFSLKDLQSEKKQRNELIIILQKKALHSFHKTRQTD